MLKDYIKQLVSDLVDTPDAVVIEEVQNSRNPRTRFEIHTAPKETGQLIGHDGEIAKALRRIINAVARRRGLEPINIYVVAE